MNRYMFAAAFLLATASWTMAQVPAIPGGLPPAPAGLTPGAGAAAGAPGNNVTVSNKCCSIWDFLGVQQVGKLVQGAFRTRLGQAIGGFLSPLGKVLGLGPSILSDKFAKEGGAMGLANQLKKEEKKVPLKVQAIRYLGTLDCVCYPEIVDALLASLDDCAEVVRYEALKALRKQCEGPTHCKDGSCSKGDVGCVDVCQSCQCQKKVVDRLNDLLLERDPSGCLKEKSQRVRDLATQMIEECLSCRQPPPADSQAPSTPATDPVPTPISDPAPPTAKSSSRSYIPSWFKWKEPEIKPLTAVPVKTRIVESSTDSAVLSPRVHQTHAELSPRVQKAHVELAPRTTKAPVSSTSTKPASHTSFYRAPSQVAQPAVKMESPKPMNGQQLYSTRPAVKHQSTLIIPQATTRKPIESVGVQPVMVQKVESKVIAMKTPVESKPALKAKTVESKPLTVKSVEDKKSKPQPVVIQATPGRFSAPKQRHIIGEVFGY